MCTEQIDSCRNKKKAEVGTTPYSYQMISKILYNVQYRRQHCTLQTFEQFGALYMHKLDPAGTWTQLPLSFEPQPNQHWGQPPANTRH